MTSSRASAVLLVAVAGLSGCATSSPPQRPQGVPSPPPQYNYAGDIRQLALHIERLQSQIARLEQIIQQQGALTERARVDAVRALEMASRALTQAGQIEVVRTSDGAFIRPTEGR